MLNEALKYLGLGFSVIPLRPKGKEPLITWTEYQKRRATESEVKDWFTKWTDANLGIVTGIVSSIVIVDLDGPEGMQEAERLGLSSPLTTITGKGKHLWYKHPGTPVTGNVRIYPGIDLRGDGNYVLVTPSTHPNGNRYRFNRPLSASLVESLPVFPTALFVKVVPTLATSADASYKPKLDIATLLEEMKDGNIDDTLFRICSRLRNDGYSRNDARALLENSAKRAGATPGHLEDKIENVWGRYEPKRSGFSESTNKAIHAGTLVLHSPTNQDSIREYQSRTTTQHAMDMLATGYEKFDTLTKGLRKGEVLTVAARTGVGKTNWVITPIRQFCQAGKKVLLFSTEMSFDQIWSRYTQTLGRDAEQFRQHQFFICDEFTPNIERIEEAIKNVMPDLFVFDHISHIGTDYHIISKFMSEIKRLARTYNIPAIVTAQLNRNADYVDQGNRVEPRLSMIQGSDQIGQMSAQVLLLNEKKIMPEMTEIEGIVVKNRHGDKGLISFGLVKEPFYRMVEL